jgi:hypothetical protein
MVLVNPKLETYAANKPKFDIQEYFNGEIKAWGVVQDWRGRITTRFDVDMYGVWKGDRGVLNERFTYYNGDRQNRVWKIKKLNDHEYQGTADDIVGIAQGEQKGNAVNWHYAMQLPVNDKTYHFKFDDWMWQLNDGIVINRSYIKKFGITVAELTLFMQKVEK